MEKIAQTLKESIRQNPEKSYRVLVVTKEGSSTNDLEIKNYKLMMDNILLAELKGSKILKLAEKESVQSIELDQEMSIT